MSTARFRSRRRRMPALLLATLLAVTSAACARSENSGNGGGDERSDDNGDGVALPECPVDALDAAEGVVEIDLWHALAAESRNALEEIAADFNESQDEVKVNVLSQGVAYDEVLRKYVSAIPSGDLPGIAYLEDTTLRQLVDSETILPAQACEEADGFETGQLPVVRNYYSADGIYWPGYTNVSEPVFYYNAVQFEDAGLDLDAPPSTLDEVREAAEALKESGVEAPMAYILQDWFLECWITGAGASVVNNGNGRDAPPTEATFDNPTTREIYTWIKGMADDGLLQGFSATDAQINHYLAIAQKNSTMGPETSTAATTIKAVLGGETYEDEAPIDPGSVSFEGLDPRAAPFPGLEEPAQVRVSGGAFFMTNTGSDEEQAAAWEFMKFMWSTESQVKWHLQGSYLPTTQAAAGSPEVTEYWENDLAGKILKVGYEELLAINPENPGPQIGPYLDYANAIENSLDRLVLQGASVDEVVADAQAEIQEALDRYNEDFGN